MPLRIVRNDITKMNTEAIVNTANAQPRVSTGCDSAIYKAAGYEELLSYRKEKIGPAAEGQAFITPGFHLQAKYIIHAVSPLYMDGSQGEEEKLRSCYRESLRIAKENHIRSIAFPLISTGSFGYPKEEGMRIAVDEIHAFLLGNEMEIYLVVFDEKTTQLGGKIYPGLEEYIDRHYVEVKQREEYWDAAYEAKETALYDEPEGGKGLLSNLMSGRRRREEARRREEKRAESAFMPNAPMSSQMGKPFAAPKPSHALPLSGGMAEDDYPDFEEEHGSRLEERMRHLSDTFSQYLLFLIRTKNMKNADVYRRAVVDKKIFSKIKNNVDYHPNKLTALCLCVGAKLSMDESVDLLARAGYALSPSDKTDIIFSYFIENGIYDMIEIAIQLELYGLPCIIE